MSLFRKPKKQIQRRVFSGYEDDEDIENNSNTTSDNKNDINYDRKNSNDKKKEKKIKDNVITSSSSSSTTGTSNSKVQQQQQQQQPQQQQLQIQTKSSLLSFDDEEEGEVFQVKKSSHSKKVMRMLDKERRKKKTRSSNEYHHQQYQQQHLQYHHQQTNNQTTINSSNNDNNGLNDKTISSNIKNNDNYDNDNTIQTEIRTDDFVLVVKKSEPDPIILNGRAALCAGKNDLTSEEEDDDDEETDLNDNVSGNSSSDLNLSKNKKSINKLKSPGAHKFSHPDNFKMVLESGKIPDAAMIHAARKRRQKAREEGEFITIEEPKSDHMQSTNNRLALSKTSSRLDDDDDCTDDDDEEERVDMSNITGVREREERREKFLSIEHDNTNNSLDDDESDNDINNVWEQQQIRKGVNGVQLMTSNILHQHSHHNLHHDLNNKKILSTGQLLDQAYAKTNLLEKIIKSNKNQSHDYQHSHNHHQQHNNVNLSGIKHASNNNNNNSNSNSNNNNNNNNTSGPLTPNDIKNKLNKHVSHLNDLHEKHKLKINEITNELNQIKIENDDNLLKTPLISKKYRFYQELRCYANDLIECLDEKLPKINELEKKTINLMGKYSNLLIERRRQDIRDQVKEMTDASKTAGVQKKIQDDEEHIRRTAEREGRRTRRRRDRERNNINLTHFDGMSSDDEITDQDLNQYKINLEQIINEKNTLFDDTESEFHNINDVLIKFMLWREYDMDSYKDAYVNLCLPKILGPLIRLHLVTWNPLDDNCLDQDIEKMSWFNIIMKYGYSNNETEETLLNDPDLCLIPSLIEKIILPKITELIENYWDPLSTKQTLKLVGLISRLGRDYPSIRSKSKILILLFTQIFDKIKLSLDNDVFIPIFVKQIQESKSSFFQRQFNCGLKLFRNILSWQGILSDNALKELAVTLLLNRYLLSAMRICTPTDAITKCHTIVNTLPRIWLQPDNKTLTNMDLFVQLIKSIELQLDKKNSHHLDAMEKITKILSSINAIL